MTSLIRSDAGLPDVTRPGANSVNAARIREMYDKGVKDIREQTLTYQENSSYIEGQQWVYRHRTRNEITELPRISRRVRATIPRLGPESRRLFSKLLKRPLVFEVTPDAPDDETIRGAKIAEGVLSDLAVRQKWERIREELAWAVWKGGTAALCLDWDTSAGRYLSQSPLGRDAHEGDVSVTALAISEMATEPGTRDIEKACWWIKAQAVPPSEVKKMYGLASEPAADASSAMSPVQSKASRAGSGETPKNLSLVLTYYERPSKENGKGTVATVVGDKIVDGPHPWPFPFKDRLNLVCTKETVVEGRWTGRTVVSDAVPVQTALNHSWTSILEHLKQCGNARFQNNSVERNNAENWTDDPGEFVFFDDQPWTSLSPPTMPDWWQRTPTELSSAMDDIIGVHDVSRGAAPANIESGLGLSILSEQDDTPTGRMSQTMADCWGDLATMILQTYEQNVLPTETRTAKPSTPGAYVSEKFTWNGLSFAGQTTVRVPYDAVAPINEAARWARALSLMDRQVITNAQQLSAYIDVPGSMSLVERVNPQVAKARRENYELGQGEPCVPADFDNHAVHIEEHNVFRLSARYERLDDHTRSLVDMHVQAHMMLAAEEAARQQFKMMNAPALAAAAQASQPPGSATSDLPPQMGPGGMAPASAVMGARDGGNPDTTSGGNPTPSPMEPQLQ